MSYHITGISCSCDDALEMLEIFIPDNMPDEVKNEQFSVDYEETLNRVRCALSKQIPTKPQFRKGKYGSQYDSYTCSHCGFGIRRDLYEFCPKCGQMIDWKGCF